MEINNDELETLTTWFEAFRNCDKVELERADYILAKRFYEHLGYAVPTEIVQGTING